MKRQRGDTVIEVLFAIAIFSMVAVAGLATMNRGMNAVQTSLEITQTRSQIDAQADMLRMVHQAYSQAYIRGKTDYDPGSYAALWRSLTQVSGSGYAKTSDSTAVEEMQRDGRCIAAPPRSFALNPQAITTPITAISNESETYARVRLADSTTSTATAEGIWVEAVRGGMVSGSGGFTDFYIYGCWPTAGGTIMTLGTIVRLYEPN